MALQTNGRLPRKQLSDQLDRFDSMLEGLSEALNATIADAVRDGTRLALKDAVVEILTDPALRSKLRDATDPVKPVPASSRASFWQAAKARVASAVLALKVLASMAFSASSSAAVLAVSAIRNPAKIVAAVSNVNRLVTIGVSAGLVVAVVSYFAPHAIAAGLSGIAGTAAAISLRAGNWTRRARPTAIS